VKQEFIETKTFAVKYKRTFSVETATSPEDYMDMFPNNVCFYLNAPLNVKFPTPWSVWNSFRRNMLILPVDLFYLSKSAIIGRKGLETGRLAQIHGSGFNGTGLGRNQNACKTCIVLFGRGKGDLQQIGRHFNLGKVVKKKHTKTTLARLAFRVL
jgi:hypothetical protein